LIAHAPAEVWVSFPGTLSGFGPGTQMRWPDRKPAPHGLSMKQPGVELRFYRDPRCANQSWLAGGSLDRPAEGVRWERNSLVPRYHLPYDVSMVEVSETLASTDELAVWQVARRYADAKTGLPHESVLDLLGAAEAIIPAAIAPDAYRAANDVSLVPRPSALPRAWIVHEVVALSELHSHGRSAIDARTEEVLFPDGQPHDWLSTAVVEAKSHLELISNGSSRIDDEEKCLITYDGPQRVEIDVKLARSGLVVLRDRFDPDWQLSIKTNDMTREAVVMRTNRLMRGAMLPAGKHRLIYRYEPRGFWIGPMISGASILSLTLTAIVIAARRRLVRNQYASAR
jgi:hypothetical protein